MSGPPALPPLDGTLGAIEVGGIVSTFLFGIETLQVYHYFRKYPGDALLLKLAVAADLRARPYNFCLAFDLRRHGDILLQAPASSGSALLPGDDHLLRCTEYVVVQFYFANRVRVFSGRWLIPVICWILTILRVTGNLTMMGIQWANPNVTTLQVKYRWLMATALSLGVTVDVVITLSMCYWLWRARQSRFEPTRRMVDTLLVWTVETGVSTTVASAMLLILFLVRSDLAWFPFFLVQVKLYSNSLLVSLNGREGLRSSTKILELSSGSFGQSAATGGNRGMVVEMSRITETDAAISKDLERGRDLRD
ncbi:hypothetical protein B0H13DRAFT_2559625 [Mycena leptocephala]|nr:hypothetical protein B0H13DRAFT_2559625 [Mycena leptocephala]